MLLQRGIAKDAQCIRDGFTSLHLSAKRGDVGCIRALIAAGADTEVRTKVRPSLAACTAPRRAPPVATIPPTRSLPFSSRLPQNEGFHALHLLAQRNDADGIRALCAAGPAVVNFNPRDPMGVTPLHVAAKCSRLEALQALLSVGAEKDVVDYDGTSALHCAAGNGSDACVRALLAVGADSGLKDRLGNAAVHVAAEKGSDSAVREFVLARCKLLLRNEARARAAPHRPIRLLLL